MKKKYFDVRISKYDRERELKNFVSLFSLFSFLFALFFLFFLSIRCVACDLELCLVRLYALHRRTENLSFLSSAWQSACVPFPEFTFSLTHTQKHTHVPTQCLFTRGHDETGFLFGINQRNAFLVYGKVFSLQISRIYRICRIYNWQAVSMVPFWNKYKFRFFLLCRRCKIC